MLDQLSFPLPALSETQVSAIPADLDARSVAVAWFSQFVTEIKAGNIDGIVQLFVPNGEAYWRDVLSLTWDLRTFAGTDKIRQFLQDRLSSSNLSDLEIVHDKYLGLQKPYEDIVWIQFLFKFSAGTVGNGNGVVRLVPIFNPNTNTIVEWKAHAVLTLLEELKSFPEQVSHLRNSETYRGKWREERQKEISAYQTAETSPTVLIVGAGQSGLEVAARLKCLGISSLAVEKEPRIGGNWRARYSALCLHDPVWYDHMPYLPFPSTWPVYSPAIKMANWLESYAEALDLNVLTNSTVTHAGYDERNGLWTVAVSRRQDSGKVVELEYNVKHVVFAAGFHGGEGRLPQYPGMETFKGQMLHSLQHKNAMDHAGKRVVVVGACTSAHDIAADYYDHGIDVTMFQRSSTYIMSTRNGFKVIMNGTYEENGLPIEIADTIVASFPNLMMIQIGQRQVKDIAELDKDLLDGLRKRGFRINWGYRDAGILLSAWTKAGGYYLDVGASQLVIDGKIKLKNDSQIQKFEPDGIRFEDGSFLPADVVIFATGLGDPRAAIEEICGADALKNISPVYGLDDEGEFYGLYRDMGIPGLWCMMGNLALCRFYSKHIALQIKAIEENIFGTRYTN